MNFRVLALTVFGLVATAGFLYEADSSVGKGSVTLYLSTDCPVAMAYTPRIQRLVAKYSDQGFEFQGLFPNELESERAIVEYARERSYTFPVRLDLGGERARKDGVTHVPTLVVRDAKGAIVYRGPLDDAKDIDRVQTPYVTNALDALLAGRKPKVGSAPPVGCLLMAGTPVPAVASVTYAEHVKPIVDRHCVTCHRPRAVAPFSLMEYDNARKWSKMIALVTGEKRMPPWKAVEGHGDFLDVNRLTPQQVETLKRWAEAGAPRGSSAREPVTPRFNSGWVLGEPDLVVSPSRSFKVSAEGGDVYRHFVIDPKLDGPTYVTAVDVRPGNPKVVHHVILYLDETGAAERLAARQKDGQDGYTGFGGPGFVPGGSLGGWAPGMRARHLPSGTGYLLKPGVKLVMQVHYHPTGKDEADQTQVGLYFSKVPVEREVQIGWLFKFDLRLPAGESKIVRTKEFPIPTDVTIYSVMPHMHLLGREMKATLIRPDGTRQALVYIEDWDFNWQMQYYYREPVKVPKGSKILVEATFDNSEGNPRNPNRPPKTVTFGEATTDEMFLLVASFSVDRTR